MFLCLQCTHVYAYSGQDVRSESFQERSQSPHVDDDHVVCSEIRCATKNCLALLRIHAVVDAFRPDRKLADAISAQKFHVSCSNGHPAQPQVPLHVEPSLADSEWWMD
jgi:hypothetical protein